MNKYLIIGLFALAALCLGMWLKHDRDRLVSDLEISSAQVATLKSEVESASQALAARDALDKKYFEEMTHAKNENDRLRTDVAAGTRRVLVHASCKKSVPGTAGTTGLDDGAEPTLDPITRDNYFRLRDQIVILEKKVAGLQAYYRMVVQVKK